MQKRLHETMTKFIANAQRKRGGLLRLSGFSMRLHYFYNKSQ